MNSKAFDLFMWFTVAFNVTRLFTNTADRSIVVISALGLVGAILYFASVSE